MKNTANLISAKLSLIRKSEFLPTFLSEVLTGLILGDAHLSKSSPTSNTRLEMSFKDTYFPFCSYVYGLFIYYSGSKPNYLNTKSSLGHKLHGSIRFKTLSLPVFNYYHSLFYN